MKTEEIKPLNYAPVPAAPSPPKGGVITIAEQARRVSLAGAHPFLVSSLLPESSVNILVGDSGLGKSPLAYQLAVAVASGSCFLGRPTTQGPVLLLDMENGTADCVEMVQRLSGFLGLRDSLPASLFVSDSDSVDAPTSLPKLEAQIRALHLRLIIIDSLRAFEPAAEDKNPTAAKFLSSLKRLARLYSTSFLLIHHVKKPPENGTGALRTTSAMSWLLEACGARALINQSDVRLGVDAGGAKTVSIGGKLEEVSLVLKGHARIKGELGPFSLAREVDEDGSPLGYRILTGIEVLFSKEQEASFRKLPGSFSFTEAKHMLLKSDGSTMNFLNRCLDAGILTRTGEHRSTRYIKGKGK